MSVMPDTGFEPTMAMALAATVVKRKAMTKTIRMAVTDCSRLPPSTPKWKNTKVAISAATSTESTRFIVRSRCVRSCVSAALRPPPSSFTARPTAWRMMPAWRTMPIRPAMAMPPMPSGLPMYWKRFSAVSSVSGCARISSRVTPSRAASAAGSMLPASEPTSGTMMNHTRHEPAVMMRAYLSPMM